MKKKQLLAWGLISSIFLTSNSFWQIGGMAALKSPESITDGIQVDLATPSEFQDDHRENNSYRFTDRTASPSERKHTVVPQTELYGASENIQWSLDGGILTIEGTGKIEFDSIPWGDSISGVTEIHVGEGIDTIGRKTFEDHENLEHVELPESLEVIEERAFSDCVSLQNVNFPDGVKEIGKDAFNSCTALTEVILPSGVETLGNGAFGNCTGVQKVWIPKGYNHDGNVIREPFFGCDGLKEIEWEEGRTEIPAYLFSECDGLEEVILPEGIVTIRNRAFDSCENLRQVKLPESLEVIENHAFWGCNNLQNVNFPDGVKEIGKDAFNGCTALTEVILPSGVETLGNGAFGNCTGVQKVWIPKGYNHDGNGIRAPFFGCDGLKEIEWEEGRTEIPAYLFNGCGGLNEVTIPDGITQIGRSAFEACENLQKVTIGRHVTSIGTDAFSGCPNLVIYCESGSVAQRYAEELGITYEFFDGHIHHFSDWIIEREADYNHSGLKTRVCDGCGLKEEEIIPQMEIDWDVNEEYAKAIIQVNDNETQNGVAEVKITFIHEDERYEAYTDENGYLSYIIPKGSYNITVEKIGYQTRNLRYIFEAGEQELPVISLSESSFVSGSLKVTEMTLDEIEKAGIDISNPDNQHIYKYAIKLEFMEALQEYEMDISAVSMKNSSGQIVFQGFEGDFGDGTVTLQKGRNYEFTSKDGEIVKVSLISERLILVIYGEAHWLKEMFKAELLVVNTSMTDTMENCEAKIILPDGMSLADMEDGHQESIQRLEEIAPGEQKNLVWYLRGDKEGDYQVSVEMNGVLQPFEESFYYEFTTEEPVHVYAGDALRMTVTIPSAAYYNEMYPIKINLTNVSDKALYHVSNEITDIEQYVERKYRVTRNGETTTETEKEWLSVEHIENGAGRVYAEVLHPGDGLEINLSTRIMWKSNLEQMKEKAAMTSDLISVITAAGTAGASYAAMSQLMKLISYLEVQYRLVDSSVITMQGSTTTIPVDFIIEEEETPTVSDKIADVLQGELIGSLIGSSDLLRVVKATYDILKNRITSYFEGEDLSELEKQELETSLGLVSPYSTLSDFVLELFPFEQTTIKVSVLRDQKITDKVALTCTSKSESKAKTLSGNSEPLLQTDGSWIVEGNTELTLNAKEPGSYTLRLEADGKVQDIPLEFYDGTLINGAAQKPEYIYLPTAQKLENVYIAYLNLLGFSLYNSAGEEAQAGEWMTTGFRLVDNDVDIEKTIIVRGDINCDGQIDEEDVQLIGDDQLNEIEKEASTFTDEASTEEENKEILQGYIENQKDPDRGQDDTDKPSGGHGGGGSSGGSTSPVGGSYGGNTEVSDYYSSENIKKGTWTYVTDGFWTFSDLSGQSYVNVWALIENPYAGKNQNPYGWFSFDETGRMRTGWFNDPTDGCTYYLNPVSDNTLGQMITGWHWILGADGAERCFYFEEASNGRRGALYRNGTTPDGYRVDENGAWIENGTVVTR